MSTRRCMHPLRRRGQTPAARMLDTPSGLASSCPTDAMGGQCTRDCSRARQCHGFEVTAKTQDENAIVRSQPTGNTDAPMSAATSAPLFSRSAGPLAIAAGTLLIVGQAIWWPFDQQKNLPQHKMTSSTPAASSTFVASAYSCRPSSVSTEGRRTGLGGWVRSVSLPPSWARCFSVGTCGSKALPFRGLPRARFRRFSAAIRLFYSPSVQPRVTCSSLLAARVEVKQDGDS
jgi:hypothetical protein